MRPRRIDDDLGWVNREFAALKRQIRELKAEKRLPRSTFPPRVIPTSALVAPSAPGYVNLSVTNIGASVAGADVITSTVVVPAGFTSCVVSLTGRVFAYNSTAAADWLYAQVRINGLSGNAYPVPAAATGGSTDSALNVATLTVVLNDVGSGGTFDVSLWAATAVGTWAADPSNGADLAGTVGWF